MLTGFVLAAGFGTRLKPLTDHLPKALVPVCGQPLLRRALEWYKSQGIELIGVNSHHFPELMAEFHKQSSIPFTVFHENVKIRGTGGALYFARDFLSQTPEFFCSNVDIITPLSIEELYPIFMDMDCVVGLVAVPVAGKGSICYNASTKEYRGARTDLNATGAGADFVGLAFYKKEFLSLLDNTDFSIVPVWKRVIELGHSVKVIEVGNPYWKDVGTPQAFAQIHFDVLEKRLSLSLLSDVTIDFDNKRAYSTLLSSREISRIGKDVWSEASRIPEGMFLERCIVMKETTLPIQEYISNKIVTPWGNINI